MSNMWRLRQRGPATGIGRSPTIRCLSGALLMATILALQGCASLTVLALAEVLNSVNESRQAQEESAAAAQEPEQSSTQASQRSQAISSVTSPAPREPLYRIRLDKATIEAGTPVRLYTATSLESKTLLGSVRGVEETLLVFDPKGREIRRGSKKATAGSGQGQYRNSFELVLPRQAPAGSYRLVTEVYLGTEMVAREELKLTLTSAGGQRQGAQAR